MCEDLIISSYSVGAHYNCVLNGHSGNTAISLHISQTANATVASLTSACELLDRVYTCCSCGETLAPPLSPQTNHTK